MMEARLFWISMGCGLYSIILRSILKHRKNALPRWVPFFFNSLFLAAAGGLAGMVAASYSDQNQKLLWWVLGMTGPGLIIGWLWDYAKPKKGNFLEQLMVEDLEWADTGFSAILLASVIMYAGIQAFKIPSGSMRMTFLEGDHLFVNKFIYGVHVPLTHKNLPAIRPIQRKDIIIFRFPTDDPENSYYGKDFIKRVIGLPGDTVQVKQKKVYVNGKPLDEPYAQHLDSTRYPQVFFMPKEDFQTLWEKGGLAHAAGQNLRDNFGPVVVPPNHYFAMGDNRDFSFDSRFWGPVPRSYIKGRAWVLYWPLSRFRIAKLIFLKTTTSTSIPFGLSQN